MTTPRSIRPPAVAVTATTLVVLLALAAGATERRSSHAIRGVPNAHAVTGSMAETWLALATARMAPAEPAGCPSAPADDASATATVTWRETDREARPAFRPGDLRHLDLPPPIRA